MTGTLFGVGHYSRLGHYSNNYGSSKQDKWNKIEIKDKHNYVMQAFLPYVSDSQRS